MFSKTYTGPRPRSAGSPERVSLVLITASQCKVSVSYATIADVHSVLDITFHWEAGAVK